VAKIIQVSHEEAEEGLNNLEELFADDELWQEELNIMLQFVEEEIAVRDAEYAEMKNSEQE
jgi:hypothetical protein